MITKTWKLSLLAGLLLVAMAPAAEIRGIITQVDAEKNQVVLEARGLGVRGAIMAFVLDKDSQILIGQQPGQLTTLTPGKHVRVVYEIRDGKNVVQVLHGGILGGLLGNPDQPGAAIPLDQLLGKLPLGNGAAKPGQPGAAIPLDQLLGKLPLGNGPARSAEPPLAEPADPNAVVGKLQRVALTDREITVVGPGPKGPQTETNLVVPEGVKITRGDATIKLEELKEGEQVAVSQQKRDGKTTAESIQVLGASAAAGQPTPQPFIGRARQYLQLADQFLQMMEQGGLQR